MAYNREQRQRSEMLSVWRTWEPNIFRKVQELDYIVYMATRDLCTASVPQHAYQEYVAKQLLSMIECAADVREREIASKQRVRGDKGA